MDVTESGEKRLLGLGDRDLTDRFRALASHYLFEPCFARPGQGHDKGGVESRGKSIRLQHLTPIVSGPDLEAISAAVRQDVERLWRERRHGDGRLLPSVRRISRILTLYGLTHGRTGWYDGEELDWLPVAARVPLDKRKHFSMIDTVQNA